MATEREVDIEAVERPVNLNLAKQLRSDEEFRNLFFRASAQNEIASQIIKLRGSKRQEELAREAGMKQSAISRIEQADYGSWNYHTLMRIAEALNATVRVLFEPVDDVIKRYEEEEKALDSTSEALVITNEPVSTYQVDQRVASYATIQGMSATKTFPMVLTGRTTLPRHYDKSLAYQRGIL